MVDLKLQLPLLVLLQKVFTKVKRCEHFLKPLIQARTNACVQTDRHKPVGSLGVVLTAVLIVLCLSQLKLTLTALLEKAVCLYKQGQINVTLYLYYLIQTETHLHGNYYSYKFEPDISLKE